MSNPISNALAIEVLGNITIGPGYDKAAALTAIDQTVALIERILEDMEAQDKRESHRDAFQRFMLALAPALAEMAGRIKVKHNVSWIKIESLVNGHKIYVSKGKLAVGRVDSTLPPEMVPGARHAGQYNGKIASWLPAEIEAVDRAIALLGSELIRPLKKK